MNENVCSFLMAYVVKSLEPLKQQEMFSLCNKISLKIFLRLICTLFQVILCMFVPVAGFEKSSRNHKSSNILTICKPLNV